MPRPWLLDINFLVPLMWPSHIQHNRALDWFELRRADGIRSCPLTQLGFIRLLTDPKIYGKSVTMADATHLLSKFTALPEHDFWADSLAWSDVEAAHGPLQGHKQITDAYLLALAAANGARFLTLDRGVMSLRGAEGVAELLA